MTTHLTEQNLVDALEAPRAFALHLDACGTCRGRLAGLRGDLQLARDADVPEPSPWYWEAFRRQVERRIDAEPRRFPGWRFVPVFAAAAAAVVAFASVLPWASSRSVAPAATISAWSALPPSDQDPDLPVLRALALSGELSPEADCQGVTDCLSDLSDEESRALTETPRTQLKGSDL